VGVPMETKIVDKPQDSRFELYVDGEAVGFLTYERAAEAVALTEVTTDLRRAGQGLGLVLVRMALDAVSDEGLAVLPVSPFVRDYIARHPVYLDLVPEDERHRFELPGE
jgi:predicted GNAT family acetyltransferase